MLQWLWLPGAALGYLAVTRWLLPRLGVKT
jgi:hypothetical protein